MRREGSMASLSRFTDRRQAGRLLAEALADYRRSPRTWVLALPRGGVPVGAEIAAALDLPLDVWLVRKLGVPGHEELAMGAIAPGGIRWLDQALVADLQISEAALARVTAREEAELQRRLSVYRGDRPLLSLLGRTVILVDDGVATGASLRAAIAALRQQQPARIVVAVPVIDPGVARRLRPLVDDLVALLEPRPLEAVGLWYVRFDQTEDAEVQACLVAARDQEWP